MSKVLLSPSILSADYGRLAQEVGTAEAAGADWIHVDVMDGHYVPNLTVGPAVVASLRHHTKLPLDVHLMVSDAGRWLEPFAKAGADVMTVHEEACPHLDAVLRTIRSLGRRVGVALNPHTPESVLDYVLEELDLVLVMTVNPGFGGQEFIASQLTKIERLARLLERRNPSALIQVDGGISPANAKRVVDAGARVLVAGAAIFGQADPKAAIAAFRAAVE